MIESRLEVMTVASGARELVHSAPAHFEAPNWSRDGGSLLFNQDGRDGRIWWNSARTGSMKIWRMDPDGRNQVQMTSSEEWADWFPHPSPGGERVVFLSYEGSVEGHPPNKEVALRLISSEGGDPVILARLFGGQGPINVPSWSPDGERLAFVSYRLRQ